MTIGHGRSHRPLKRKKNLVKPQPWRKWGFEKQGKERNRMREKQKNNNTQKRYERLGTIIGRD